MANAILAHKDTTAVTMIEQIRNQLSRWPEPVLTDSGVVVPTMCLFPSGSFARVIVARKSDAFVVHDGGQGIDEFSNIGGENHRAIQLLRSHFRERGIKVSPRGELTSPDVRLEELSPTIALIANASTEAAMVLSSRWKPSIRRDFKKMLKSILEIEFAASHPKQSFRVVGSSQKQHVFDFALDDSKGGLILVDAVHNDANAISSAVLRNLDVRSINSGEVEQRIIYDDAEEWRAEDLNLLSLGARAVPFSKMPMVLNRLAA